MEAQGFTMNNFDAYLTNIIYGIILLLGYNFCGILPTILGFLTWFMLDKILGSRFEDERKAAIVGTAVGIAVAVISSLILKKVLF